MLITDLTIGNWYKKVTDRDDVVYFRFKSFKSTTKICKVYTYGSYYIYEDYCFKLKEEDNHYFTSNVNETFTNASIDMFVNLLDKTHPDSIAFYRSKKINMLLCK